MTTRDFCEWCVHGSALFCITWLRCVKRSCKEPGRSHSPTRVRPAYCLNGPQRVSLQAHLAALLVRVARNLALPSPSGGAERTPPDAGPAPFLVPAGPASVAVGAASRQPGDSLSLDGASLCPVGRQIGAGKVRVCHPRHCVGEGVSSIDRGWATGCDAPFNRLSSLLPSRRDQQVLAAGLALREHLSARETSPRTFCWSLKVDVIRGSNADANNASGMRSATVPDRHVYPQISGYILCW